MFKGQKYWLILFSVCILFISQLNIVSGQGIKYPESPKFETLEERTKVYIPDQRYKITPPVYPGQQRIIDPKVERTNREAMIKMGHTPPPTEEEIRAEINQARQMQFSTIREKKLHEYNQLIEELRQESISQKQQNKRFELRKVHRLADPTSTKYQTYSPKYFYAHNEINKMLYGESPFSLKKAVWLVESAHSEYNMTYEEYSRLIAEKVALVKYILKREKFKETNHSINFATQLLFSDTITEYDASGKVKRVHYPFTYDFEDMWGDNGYSYYWVSKLLKKGKGQCHSMPLLYLILIEELGATAYLSYSPEHSFIMAYDDKNQIYQFETTNGRVTTRDWIMRGNYLKVEAIANKIFLCPLNKREVLAQQFVDLAGQYIYDLGNDEFVEACAKKCLKYFPNSIQGKMTITNYAVAQCTNVEIALNFPPYSEYEKYPNLKKLYDTMLDMEAEIEMLGYEEMPKQAYEEWLRSVDNAKNKAMKKELKSQCVK